MLRLTEIKLPIDHSEASLPAAMCVSFLTDEPEGVSLRKNSPFGFLQNESAR